MRRPPPPALCRAALALCLGLAPAPAAANAITFAVWPSGDPDEAVFCTLRLERGRISAVEVQGMGLTASRPMRWPAREAEVAALMQALRALVAGELPSVADTYASRPPGPPYVSATWMARVGDGLASGLYLQPGLRLPPALDRVIGTALAGGLCAGALGG